MSTFDQFNDTPYQIKNEGEQISVKFKRLDASTGEISWNIPKNTDGSCQGEPMYDGILLTIDESPTSPSKQPTDGTTYVADPSTNPNTHMGDKIGTALVVGFYTNDKTTTTSVVTDLDPAKTYYVSAHALSNVMTYHSAGVHAYSVSYGDEGTSDTPAIQQIIVGTTNEGVELFHPTGFQAGETYTLDMILDYDRRHTFTFNGGDIQTYQELIDEWNRQAMLVDNPLQSPTIPNTGMYYYNKQANELSQWDGVTHQPLPVFVNDEQPNIVALGDTWFNPSTSTLYEATSISPVVWTPQTYIIFDHDPVDVQCDDLWFDGTELFRWSGSSWLSNPYFNQNTDPSLPPTLDCSAHWFNGTEGELNVWDEKCSAWKPTLAQLSDTDPSAPAVGHLWFNDAEDKLYEYDGAAYVEIPVEISTTEPTTVPVGQHWYNPETMELFVNNAGTFDPVDFLLWDSNPTMQETGALWWNSSNDTLWQWDDSTNGWKSVTPFYIQNTDPSLPPVLEIGTVWTVDNITYQEWDGSEWKSVCVVNFPTDPATIPGNTYWFDKTNNVFMKRMAGAWAQIEPLTLTTDPVTPSVGDFWFDSDDELLYQYDGANYVNTPYSPTPLTPTKGYTYFDTTLGTLRTWNGYGWVDGEPLFTVRLSDDQKCLVLETGLNGSDARVEVGHEEPNVTGYIANSFPSSQVGQVPEFFRAMVPPATPLPPTRGGDGLQPVPSYAQLGIGTDGSDDERRELMDSIRHQLGYPQIEVELTKQQMNYAIDSAIESLRKRSGMAYKRGFMFIDVEPRQQQYLLTDKRIGYNRIVEVTELHRVTSAFLAHPEGRGTYGQMVLQQLYSMGSFDLISYHLVSQYIETMEQLFASKLNFMWNEDERKLSIFKEFYRKERVLMEVAVERTEQAMIKDRYLKSWIEKYAMVMCRLMLADIRGKYGSLPGAGGGVTLNAGELAARADVELQDLYQQIDDHIVNNPEEYGAGATVIIG